MDLVPYLNFNGNCAEAFAFYEQALGGKIAMTMTFGETPAKEHVPANWQDKIMHVALQAGGRWLYGSDGMPSDYKSPAGMSVALDPGTVADGQRIFDALSAGGNVTMKFEKTFWSPGFGSLVDKFGIPWMINVAQPAP
jgi:PhnB protein